MQSKLPVHVPGSHLPRTRLLRHALLNNARPDEADQLRRAATQPARLAVHVRAAL